MEIVCFAVKVELADFRVVENTTNVNVVEYQTNDFVALICQRNKKK